MNSTIRIAIADDHTLFRKSLSDALTYEFNLDVVFGASNGAELIYNLATNPVDVILLDLRMPVMSGFEALKIIRDKYPLIKVIIVSMHDSLPFVEESFERGANAHLSKDCDIEDLLDAIRMTHNYGYYFTNDFPKEMINKIINKKSAPPVLDDFIISEREKEIIRQICLEKGSKEISEELQIAERTVQNHRYKISKKIGTSSSVGFLVYALLNGIATITADGKVVFE
ncbi:response regulator transcription factor [Fluviicola taffensis]|uniref:Two component transcriptional regulator, LuxR family n=1 Tax=Fluviicola taffensis (strain DSM 16823 / NCIMB 13979 / RW262) TaxID=755732 RepID=F2IGH3_FLUTR|nr:response regulator transcription factor [Fluviicola taffensis]AEA42579.1 two component transcriptional regulator, LuxR family [Fluviicola taffensis DSM 16823]